MTDRPLTPDPLATLLDGLLIDWRNVHVGSLDTDDIAARLRAAGVTLTQPQPDAGLREALEKFVTGEGAMATDPDGDCYFCEAEGVDFELPFHPGADPDHAGEHEDWCLVPIARAALRSTPAAPEFGGSLASVQPTPAAPQPECSLLLADGTICVKRAGHSDDHGMALRSNPAAPQPDTALREALARHVTGPGAMAMDGDEGECFFCERPNSEDGEDSDHEAWCLVPIARAALRSTPAAPKEDDRE